MAQNEQSAKILLAEDDNDMRRFLVNACRMRASRSFPMTTACPRISCFREEPFQLLLTDIVMPEMDGIETRPAARPSSTPDIKIMFITGFAAVALNADSTAPKHAKVLVQADHLRDLVHRGPEDAGGGLISGLLASILHSRKTKSAWTGA